MYIIICVFGVVLIVVDEVHHFTLCSLTLTYAGLLAPIIDGILDGGIHVFANILKASARRTYATHLWKEVTFVMNEEDVASTFHLSVTDGKFTTKCLVQLLKEQVARSPCALCVEGKHSTILVVLKLRPIDVSSDGNTTLLIVDAIVLRQLVEINVCGVHVHCLKRVPKVGHRLACPSHLVLCVANIAHNSKIFIGFAE